MCRKTLNEALREAMYLRLSEEGIPQGCRRTGPHLCSPGVPPWQPREGQGWGGWNALLGPGCLPKEAVPEHLGCTSTVVGLSVVCFGAVRVALWLAGT